MLLDATGDMGRISGKKISLLYAYRVSTLKQHVALRLGLLPWS